MNLREFPIYCINLDHRKDRWLAVRSEFENVGLAVTKHSAILLDEQCDGIDASVVGCLLSHRELWKLCLSEQYNGIAVFEDDVVFPIDFIDIFTKACKELPSNWSLWHLHSANAQTQAIGKYVVQYLSGGWGSHGYYATREACNLLLQFDINQPVDSLMTSEYLRHGGIPLGVAREHTLCFQNAKDSDIEYSENLEFWRRYKYKYFR